MAMNKKAFMAAITSILIISLAIMSFGSLAQANPIWLISDVPRIKVLSPQPMLYFEDTVLLSFYGKEVSWGILEFSKFKFWLDGELKGRLDNALAETETYAMDLTALTDGQHTIEVTAIVTVKSLTIYPNVVPSVLWAPSAETSSGKLNFTLDATAPNVSILSPQNKIFEIADFALNFTVNESVSELYCSLDGKSNFAITDEVVMAQTFGKDNYCFVLNGLEEGSHSLKIFAKDAAGYTGESDTYYFTVQTQPTPTLTPTLTPTPTPSPSSSPSQELPTFTMPKEYLNYTIVTREGAPWALIDGTYPIYLVNADQMPPISMVYPTPPGTTNITIKLNETFLNWSNFTEQYPDALHHTAIGDWPMIEVNFSPSDSFVLSIHYEHPIMKDNGSYQFLYDLNISPYLSASSPTSTAYFNIKIDESYSNLKVFTVPSDTIRNLVEYVSQGQGTLREVTFAVTSEYAKALPGDVIVTFEDAAAENHNSPDPTIVAAIIIALIISVTTILVLVLFARKKRFTPSA